MADPGDTAVQLRGFFARPEVAGVAWRGLWKLIEPTEGTWDWSRLDAALDEAANAGKQLTVHVAVSGGAWPAWLTTAGAATYSGTSPFGTITDPIPWDAVFLARYERLMQNLAAHLTSRGATSLVRLVSVGAPVGEMSLAGCASGTLGSGAGAVPYDRAAYLGAWTRTITAVLAQFPTTPVVVSAPVAVICRPDDGASFYTELMTPLSRATVFAADLNALGSQRWAQVDPSLRSRPLHFQTIWSSTNDPMNRMQGTLSSAVCAGRAAGARYFELYKSDLESTAPALLQAVAQARGVETCP